MNVDSRDCVAPRLPKLKKVLLHARPDTKVLIGAACPAVKFKGVFWHALWGATAERLKQASEVFIHGYSMPAADEKARELQFGNINPAAAINVYCRSMSDRVADDCRARGFGKVNAFTAIGFETWAS